MKSPLASLFTVDFLILCFFAKSNIRVSSLSLSGLESSPDEVSLLLGLNLLLRRFEAYDRGVDDLSEGEEALDDRGFWRRRGRLLPRLLFLLRPRLLLGDLLRWCPLLLGVSLRLLESDELDEYGPLLGLLLLDACL